MKDIKCKNYNIHINNWLQFTSFVQDINASHIFILADENTEKYCLLHLLENLNGEAFVIRIPSGEHNKTINTCQQVWSKLMQNGADRHSLLINLGGGVIGDLGGFCAATYMRGIRFIQVPTTLLSQVDASVGGKLGVDLLGFKNMVGIIQDPAAVFIFTEFLNTLPQNQIRSGFAELLKHGLIADKSAWDTLSHKANISGLDYENLVYESVKIKKNVTEQDPYENGLRKILNFGHTIGHAVESYWMDSSTPLLHGEAIAIGMVSEAFLSYRVGKISEGELFDIRNALIRIYGHHPKYVRPATDLIEIMKGDKKNIKGSIRFALLESVGKACYDVQVDKNAIEESFVFYKEKI
ncbi:MAG: 3-dehydroquinate synthase [Saprospiraceae bacterium]|jgi:3-dehydroquinate synthase|nr:3-dehydroquinate synthase [Saprospiraceae bacterium]MBL0023781.1 3-dehydroquinate synthase [Saprospiraceae bacterium]